MPNPDGFRAIAHSARAIPGQFGLRPYKVFIVSATWSGGMPGRGEETRYEKQILENGQNPKVHFLNEEELALGQMPRGSIEIGPITPEFPGGGTPRSALQPTDAAGETLHVVIIGPSFPAGAKYLVSRIADDHAIHFTIHATPVSTDGPSE